MLPKEVRCNPHAKRWSRMPVAETDGAHIVESWERTPTDMDVPSRLVNGNIVDGHYYGEWHNTTARDKAAWDVQMAKNEMERLRREEQRKAMRAAEEGRSSLDGYITTHRKG